MSSNFRYYRQAAQSISSGWMQWDWRNSDGEGCLVQALLTATGRSSKLPASVIAELDGELDYFRDYRLLRVTCRLFGESLEGVFMLWNDLPWRRKQQVVAVLSKLADAQEFDWQQAEQARLAAEKEAELVRITAEREHLTSQVEQLRSKVQELESRIKDLEEENGVLKRLTNARTLRADRQTLQELSDELDGTFEKLEELPELSVGA